MVASTNHPGTARNRRMTVKVPQKGEPTKHYELSAFPRNVFASAHARVMRCDAVSYELKAQFNSRENTLDIDKAEVLAAELQKLATEANQMVGGLRKSILSQ